MSQAERGPQPSLLARVEAHPAGRVALLVLRWTVPLLILGFVLYQLTRLGWDRIWSARPASIIFYLLIALQFFIQPVADLLIYRNLWGRAETPGLWIFLRKRVMNSALFDYSGEVFFFFRMQRKSGLSTPVIAHAIKDSNILSGGAGLAMVWLVLLVLVATGGLALPAAVVAHGWAAALLGSLPLLLCAALVIAHRKVTNLSRRQMAATFFLHFLRSLIVLLLEIGFWIASGALPSLVACLQLVALRLVITRLPLVPNKDLVFVGAGVAAARLLHLPAAPIASVLVVLAAADLLLSLALAGLPWVFETVFSRTDAP
jgi:hypothetical protein